LILSRGVAAASEGQITGTVTLSGSAPRMRVFDMSKDTYCSKANAKDPGHMETYVVGADGGLANVVLYISDWGGGPTASNEVLVFDQKNCMFTPHVLAMDVGEIFKVGNSDQTAHNIHPTPDPATGNTQWNQSQPPGAPPVEKSWKAPEFIEVKCNIHPWMQGWHAVVEGPYAITDANGNYTINNVPPGNYTVSAWHEAASVIQDQKVTVAAGQSVTADFAFEAN
jgi:plastocyanin